MYTLIYYCVFTAVQKCWTSADGKMRLYLLKVLRSARFHVQTSVIVCFTNSWQPLQAMTQGSTSVRMRSEAVSSERSECSQFTDSLRLREIVTHEANGKIFVQPLYTSTHRNTPLYKAVGFTTEILTPFPFSMKRKKGK